MLVCRCRNHRQAHHRIDTLAKPVALKDNGQPAVLPVKIRRNPVMT
jgi:hypothetical protein